MREVVHPRAAEFLAVESVWVDRRTAGARITQEPITLKTLSAVWRDSLLTLSTHSVPILVFALLGFAGAAITSAAVGLGLSAGSWQQRYNSADLQQLPLLIQGVVGLFTVSFARGVITRIVLSAQHAALDTTGVSLSDACRATLTRWPALLVSVLTYGGLIYAGIVGLSQVAPDLRRDLTTPRYRSGSLETILRTATIRGFQAALPDPEAPFTQKLAWDRVLTRRRINYNPQAVERPAGYQLVPGMWETTGSTNGANSTLGAQSQSPQFEVDARVIGIAGIALILLSETLLRMRFVMVMCAGWRGRLTLSNVVVPLVASARFAPQHFVSLTVHIWLLRCAMWVAGFLFIVLPLEAVYNWLVPALVRLGSTWVYTVNILVIPASLAMVVMVFNAFSIVYDACLYRQLQRRSLVAVRR